MSGGQFSTLFQKKSATLHSSGTRHSSGTLHSSGTTFAFLNCFLLFLPKACQKPNPPAHSPNAKNQTRCGGLGAADYNPPHLAPQGSAASQNFKSKSLPNAYDEVVYRPTRDCRGLPTAGKNLPCAGKNRPFFSIDFWHRF